MANQQLTGKQKLFVEYYLIHMNATKAARLAGYAGDDNTLAVTGHRLLRNAKIRAAIDAALAERVMGKNEVLSRLAGHARGDMADFAHISYASDIQEHPQARLIKKFERTITTNKEGEREEKVKLELYDAQAALVHVGRHLSLFVDKTDITSGGEPLQPVIYLPQVADDDNTS